MTLIQGAKGCRPLLVAVRQSRTEKDYQRYLEAIADPLADHKARLEMERPNVDRDKEARSFIAGRNPDDVGGIVNLFLRCHSVPHINHAILDWAQADELGDAARYARSIVFNVLMAGALLALFLGVILPSSRRYL